MAVIYTIFAIILGLCIGSFLNVVIYRLPLKKSIVSPGSACPHCNVSISPIDNIPVLSYIFLRGKCRHCGAGISPRYLIVEILTAVGFYLFLYKYDFLLTLGLARDIIFYCVGIAIIFIDIEHFIIPDVLSLPLIVIGMVFSFFIDEPGWVFALSGAIFGFLLFFMISFAYLKLKKEVGLGGGDIKYIAAIGAFVGIWGLLFVLFFSSLVALLYFLVLSIIGFQPIAKKDLPEPINPKALPFAPFLTVATIAFLLVEEWLWGIGFRF